MVFQGRYQEAVDLAFSNVPGDDLLALFKISNGDGGPEDSTVVKLPSLSQIIGLQVSYCKGVALEMTGRAREALVPYSDVSDFCRRFPSPNSLKHKGLAHFVGMAMYRYGMLCSTLAVDPRPLRSSLASLPSTGMLRGRLLYDAAVSLRMFLAFAPSVFGNTRHAAALIRYIEALEGRFRGSLYRKTFDPEQYTFTQQGTLERFSPDNFTEDIIYCTQILESLQPLLPTSRHHAQVGASSGRVRNALARMARYGFTLGLIQMSKSLFSRYAAEASTYGRLLFACAAAKRFDEASRIGEIYVELGGKEPSVLLVIAKSSLLFKSKALFVAQSLERYLTSNTDSLGNSLTKVLGLAYLSLASQSKTSLEQARTFRLMAVESLERAVVIDEYDPEAHLYLSLAYFANGQLKSAEGSIKVSLSIEVNQSMGWLIFANIKSAQKDLDTCLTVCNTFLENAVEPNITYRD